MNILSEYQEDTRNARVYKMNNGTYGCECYDSDTDETKFFSCESEQAADDKAEDWVLRHVSF